MITAPPGWTQHFGVHLVTLYPPAGGARIRFYERLRPVMRFSQVVQTVLGADPLFRVSSVHDSQTLTTDEGEYGAWARINGTRDGRHVTRFVGCVFGDEFTCALDAFVMLREQAAATMQTARELLLSLSVKLGVRRRRYLYQPPPGWRSISSGLVANWYPPDFPNNRVNLVVPAAEPRTDSVDEAVDVERLLTAERELGFELDGDIDRANVVALGGLTGKRCAFAVKHAQRGDYKRLELAAFSVEPYLYAMRMESRVRERAVEHHQVFIDAARTVAALPQPGQGRVGVNTLSGETLSHWVD